jgi:hypothetical protein
MDTVQNIGIKVDGNAGGTAYTADGNHAAQIKAQFVHSTEKIV